MSNSKNQSMQNQQSKIVTNYIPSSNYEKFSKYLGVTRVMNKEAFIATAYDSGLLSKQPQSIYLGTFDKEEDAARAYDLVSLKLSGPTAHLNFPITDYNKALDNVANMTLKDLVSLIRGFGSTSLTRGKSRFSGVFRNVETGKWQARIVEDGKERIFGAFETEVEAAVAYDVACIREKGYQAITNYSLNCYDVQSIFSANKFQQQAMNAMKIQQKAIEMQAMHAMKIWQQAMEMQAIDARKIQQQAMDMEASRRLEFQQQQQKQQQPEADPLLRLTLATGNTNLEKPLACHRSLGCENQGTEELKNYFMVWALQRAREELASASNKNFKHGEFSPFRSYQEMKLMKERLKPIGFYGARVDGFYMPPFGQWLGGLGFRHGYSGVLSDNKNDPDTKGKAKVIYDV